MAFAPRSALSCVRATEDDTGNVTTDPKYRAPALEKGLSILETLANARSPMSMSEISSALSRSRNEIFRMLQVLEDMHYISRDPTGCYSLTNRLFALSMRQPPIRDLLSLAFPLMTGLSEEAGQSCHLAVSSGAEMVVIARVEAPGLLGFAVRVGYRRPLHESASGLALLAFEPTRRQAQMIDEIGTIEHAEARTALIAELRDIREAGFIVRESGVINGIVDMSAPIIAARETRAALTIPYASGEGAKLDRETTRDLLVRTARAISHALEGTAIE